MLKHESRERDLHTKNLLPDSRTTICGLTGLFVNGVVLHSHPKAALLGGIAAGDRVPAHYAGSETDKTEYGTYPAFCPRKIRFLPQIQSAIDDRRPLGRLEAGRLRGNGVSLWQLLLPPEH